MKLIKTIHRTVNEDLQAQLVKDAELVADLDQEPIVKEDEAVVANIKEVEDRHKEDIKAAEKINGKQPKDPKPVETFREDLNDANRQAAAIRANAEAEAAQVIADAQEAENVKEAAMEADVKNNLLADQLAALLKDEWEAVDGYQNAINIANANELADEAFITELNDIVAEEYIHIGQLNQLMKNYLKGNYALNAAKGEAEVAAPAADEVAVADEIDLPLDNEVVMDAPVEAPLEVDMVDDIDDGEPAPVEADVDGFKAVEEPGEVVDIEDGEPAPLDIDQEELEDEEEDL